VAGEIWCEDQLDLERQGIDLLVWGIEAPCGGDIALVERDLSGPQRAGVAPGA
jgi:hypothetical protein